MTDKIYYTMREAADKLSVSYTTVYWWFRDGLLKHSLKAGKSFLFSEKNLRAVKVKVNYVHLRASERNERVEAIKAIYLDGKTLQEVGAHFNISRERVRQILKSVGVTGIDGGARLKGRKRTVLREKAALQKREARCMHLFGCSVDELQNVRATLGSDAVKMDHIYRTHRHRSIRETIPWSISYPQLADLIRPHISEYGKGKDKICLRIMDTSKGYEIGNIMPMTQSQASGIAGAGRKNKELIANLKDQGYSIDEICKKTGLKKTTVVSYLHVAKRIKQLKEGKHEIY